MQDRPTAEELLTTIGDLLEHQVLAATEGALKHQVRVAGNLCRILAREMVLQPDQDRHAVAQLAEVLESDAGDLQLDELNRELATRLRESADLELERRAWPALLEIVRGKLAINKPAHDAYDFSPEVSSESQK